MTAQRSRRQQTSSLADRLAIDALKLREQASHLAPGAARDVLLKKAHRNEMAAKISACLTLPEHRRLD